MLEDEKPTPRRETTLVDPGATRMRAPVRVDAQPNATPVAPPPSPTRPAASPPAFSDPVIGAAPSSGRQPEAEPPTVNRPRVVEPSRSRVGASKSPAEVRHDAGETIRRAPTAPVGDLAEAPQASRPRTVLVLAAVGVAALVIVGIGVLLTSGTSKHADTTVPVTSIDSSNPDGVGPPGPLTVVGKQVDPATAQYKWTYSNSMPSDTFAWQTEDGSKHDVSTTPTITVSNPAGTKQCLQVKVRRADGSNASLEWSAPGCVNG